jgi:hypothetical protein
MECWKTCPAEVPPRGGEGGSSLPAVARSAEEGSFSGARAKSYPASFDRAVVHFQGIVKREFFFRQVQLVAALVRLAHVFCQLNQLLNHRCCLNRPVLVSPDGLFKVVTSAGW